MLHVTNPTDKTVVLRSFDGDSVSVHAKSRDVPVADKFDWHVPAGIRVRKGHPDTKDPTAIVRGRMPGGNRIRPPKSAHEARKLAEAGAAVRPAMPSAPAAGAAPVDSQSGAPDAKA